MLSFLHFLIHIALAFPEHIARPKTCLDEYLKTYMKPPSVIIPGIRVCDTKSKSAANACVSLSI